MMNDDNDKDNDDGDDDAEDDDVDGDDHFITTVINIVIISISIIIIPSTMPSSKALQPIQIARHMPSNPRSQWSFDE